MVNPDESSDRIDYVRLSRKLDVARGLVWTAAIRDIIEGVQHEEPNIDGNFKAGTVKRYADGEYLYTVQVWGSLCKFIARLDFNRYAKYVTRLDFRMELDVTKAGLDCLADVAKQNNHANRNITTYETRPRDKKEGRHAGGIGVAVGSHGSTKRLTVYKRGKEPGALEFQTQMAETQKIVNMAAKTNFKMADLDNQSRWRMVLMHGLDVGMKFASQVFGQDFDTIVDIAAANNPDKDTRELVVHSIRWDWALLNREDKKELLYQLTMDL